MRRIFCLLLSVFCILYSNVCQAEIGCMSTKRERDLKALKEQSPDALYEKINELFLREDYEGVERLSAQFMLRASRSQHAEDVSSLRELSIIKLGYTSTPAAVPIAFTPTPTGPLKQLTFEEIPIYSVQVGSFSKVENAKATVEKLTRAHYDAYLMHDTAKPGMIRVRVGKVESRNAAQALEARLKKEGYPTKIC